MGRRGQSWRLYPLWMMDFGTLLMWIQDTGLLHTIALPVTFHAGLVFNYLDNCTIESVVGILTVPTSVLGIPILMPDVVAAVQELASQAAAMS